ncbi:MAG: L-seryl-tRNA(Sec) selenium transferase, partial [Deltaproteobacteria bacterium]|nr:L-seryl-tRNA(Sec) selenium transferase [Deltaproteobacteria bacterium]
GFTQEVPLTELVTLGHRHGLPVVEDLGSGCLLDLSRYGLEKEPTVSEALKSGADLVLFSGDKLLGGPQAGLALGDKSLVEKLKRNPLARALRPDKLTLAALEATLRLYLDEPQAVAAIPTLRMITRPLDEIKRQAQSLARRLRRRLTNGLRVRLWPSLARVGGGALPQLVLPSQALSLEHPDWPPHHLEARLRQSNPPVIARLEQQHLLLDLRTILSEDQPLLLHVLENLLPEPENSTTLIDDGNFEV